MINIINKLIDGLDGGSSGPSSTSGGRVSSSEPTYMMEHLATFTVTKETGIVYPADGMRRLLQLEKSNGIWSQKMQLRLERNWVLIMDNETGVKILLQTHKRNSVQILFFFFFLLKKRKEIYFMIFIAMNDQIQSGTFVKLHCVQFKAISLNASLINSYAGRHGAFPSLVDTGTDRVHVEGSYGDV